MHRVVSDNKNKSAEQLSHVRTVECSSCTGNGHHTTVKKKNRRFWSVLAWSYKDVTKKMFNTETIIFLRIQITEERSGCWKKGNIPNCNGNAGNDKVSYKITLLSQLRNYNVCDEQLHNNA